MEREATVIAEFIEVATDYCNFIEQRADLPQQPFLRRMQQLLPLLYFQALQLPDVHSEVNCASFMTHQEWNLLFGDLVTKLGVFNSYWEVFDPTKLDPDPPVRACLADDLADIYRDLKNGFVALSQTKDQEAAIWQWKESFESHWSTHAADALRALTWFVQRPDFNAAPRV